MMADAKVKFTINSRHGIQHNLFIEIDYATNSIYVPYSGELVGQENITTFMDAIHRAATLLALNERENNIRFKVNKNGEAAWHVVEADSAQAAVESFYDVKVYEYDRDGCVIVFDDIRDEVDQLYAVDTSLESEAKENDD